MNRNICRIGIMTQDTALLTVFTKSYDPPSSLSCSIRETPERGPLLTLLLALLKGTLLRGSMSPGVLLILTPTMGGEDVYSRRRRAEEARGRAQACAAELFLFSVGRFWRWNLGPESEIKVF